MDSTSPPRTCSTRPAPPELRLLRLDDRAVLPAYQSAQAAGLDLAACLPIGEMIVVPPMKYSRNLHSWEVA